MWISTKSRAHPWVVGPWREVAFSIVRRLDVEVR